MSTKRKRAIRSIKDKQIIISRLDKGETGTNLAQEFGISKQQISDIRENKDKILKFTDSIETSEWLKRKSLKLSDEEILATVVGDSTESESVCSDEEHEGEDEKLVSTKEAAQCWKKCLSWMESQNDPVQLVQLRRMMDFAMRSSYKSLKQTNMLEHFRPL